MMHRFLFAAAVMAAFGLPADGGYFRVVFLASPDELTAIYDDIADYAREFARG